MTFVCVCVCLYARARAQGLTLVSAREGVGMCVCGGQGLHMNNALVSVSDTYVQYFEGFFFSFLKNVLFEYG